MDLKAQSSQGAFVPSGRRDVLMTALGKKDHLGRVLGVPRNVTIKEYYGKSASRKRVVDEASILADITQHLMSNPAITTHLMQGLISNPEFKQALARELSSVGTSQDTAGHAKPSHVSTKESFSRAHVEDDELAAREREFEVQRHEHELEMKRRELELDSKRRELEMLTKAKSTSVSVSLSPITCLFSLGEDYVFEIFECPLEHDGWVARPDQRRIFAFCGDDLGNACRNNVWMNNNVFSLWCMYLHRLQLDKGVASVYGFLDPSILLPDFFVGDALSKYLGNLLGDNPKELYLAPCCMKSHWQLFVLHPSRHTVIFFCSLHQDPPPKVVEAVNK